MGIDRAWRRVLLVVGMGVVLVGVGLAVVVRRGLSGCHMEPSQLRNVADALEAFAQEHGRYPDRLEDLVYPDSRAPWRPWGLSAWKIRDRWAQPFQYVAGADQAVVWFDPGEDPNPRHPHEVVLLVARGVAGARQSR